MGGWAVVGWVGSGWMGGWGCQQSKWCQQRQQHYNKLPALTCELCHPLLPPQQLHQSIQGVGRQLLGWMGGWEGGWGWEVQCRAARERRARGPRLVPRLALSLPAGPPLPLTHAPPTHPSHPRTNPPTHPTPSPTLHPPTMACTRRSSHPLMRSSCSDTSPFISASGRAAVRGARVDVGAGVGCEGRGERPLKRHKQSHTCARQACAHAHGTRAPTTRTRDTHTRRAPHQQACPPPPPPPLPLAPSPTPRPPRRLRRRPPPLLPPAVARRAGRPACCASQHAGSQPPARVCGGGGGCAWGAGAEGGGEGQMVGQIRMRTRLHAPAH